MIDPGLWPGIWAGVVGTTAMVWVPLLGRAYYRIRYGPGAWGRAMADGGED